MFASELSRGIPQTMCKAAETADKVLAIDPSFETLVSKATEKVLLNNFATLMEAGTRMKAGTKRLFIVARPPGT
jgi:hypothetical protein